MSKSGDDGQARRKRAPGRRKPGLQGAQGAPEHGLAGVESTFSPNVLPMDAHLSPPTVLRYQRVIGNRATIRLLQRRWADGDGRLEITSSSPTNVVQRDSPEGGKAGGTKYQPFVKLRVEITRVMSSRELLIEFAIQAPNDITTQTEAEAAIEDGEVYWVVNNEIVGPDKGPEATEADKAKGYKLLAIMAPGVDPESKERLEELRQDFWQLPDDEQDEVNEQTNQLFWETTGYKPGQKLDPKNNPDDAKMAQDWIRLRAHVVASMQQYAQHDDLLRRAIYESIPPDFRKHMFNEKGTTPWPTDLSIALRVANTLSSFTPAERAEYLSRVTARTDSWVDFERALDRFAMERGAHEKAIKERNLAQSRLYGTDDVYDAYRDYLKSLGTGNMYSARMRLDAALKANDIESLEEFLDDVRAFERSFEKEGLFVANQMLDQSLHVIFAERERLSDDAEFDIFFQSVRATQGNLKQLEDDYPLLRDEKMRDALDGVLTKERAKEIVWFQTGEQQKNMGKARVKLAAEPELIYDFDVLLSRTMQAQGLTEDSVYYKIIRDKSADIKSSRLFKSILLGLLAIGIGILTLGTGTPAVLGAMAVAGIGAYETYQEYQRYVTEHTAYEAGLLSEDPSFAWVVVAAIGAGLDMVAVAKALRAMGPAIEAFDETGDFIALERKLNKLDDVDFKVRQRVLEKARLQARSRQAWGNVLRPSAGLNAVIVPGGHEFCKFVYAVYLTMRVHGKSLQVFLKTRQAQKLLGELATGAKASAGEMAKLRKGWEVALETQEKFLNHGFKLGLRADEVENWMLIWAKNPGRSLDDMMAEMAKYAEPLKSNPKSKYRQVTELMTDDETRKLLADFDLRIAGRGGIEQITARTTKAGEKVVTIEGEVLPGMSRAAEAPNFNRSSNLFKQAELDISPDNWEWAHLWGPGFGDEAAAGMMMAPREVNQIFQNRGIEGYIRDLGKEARAVGASVHVKAAATSWPNPTPKGWEIPKGADFLQRAEYKVTLTLPNGQKHTLEVVLEVAEPPNPKLLSKHADRTALDEVLEAYTKGAL